jgi:hypothetical protein
MKHGHNRRGYQTPTYRSWRAMIRRCLSPADEQYCNYGGRGITVCDRWRDFSNFLEDMGTRPEGMTLDRENNSSNYNLDNCRWATPTVQHSNKRSNVFLTAYNLTMTQRQWAHALEVPEVRLIQRRNRGMSDHDILFTPKQTNKRNVTCTHNVPTVRKNLT